MYRLNSQPNQGPYTLTAIECAQHSLNTSGKTYGTESCHRCGGTSSHPRAQCPAKDFPCQTCHKVEHNARGCRSKGKTVKQIQAAEMAQDSNEEDADFSDCTQCKHEYTIPYFQPKTETKSCHILKIVPVASLQVPHAGEHIQPLWISFLRDPTIHKMDCEVDTGVGCNKLPLYKAREIFKQE